MLWGLLASEGMTPVCAIYSTFLQRAYDQVVHDVAIQSLPVRFAMDRAGLVGADGATHAGSYTHAGPEIGVASTKAFTAQVTVLTLMALHVARLKASISDSRYRQMLYEMETIPAKVESLLASAHTIKEIATKYKTAQNALYLGRGITFPVALEGALKLKEISYIHAEGYPAGELKHGPLALIEPGVIVVAIATDDELREKLLANIAEVKSRGATVVAVCSDGDSAVAAVADYVARVPRTDPLMAPLVDIVVLQQLAYHLARGRGLNVDRPRNLAKTVTVE